MNMDMQSLIEEMNALILKIKSGAASQGEIEAFAAAAAELHERAVVLRYKSYEAKVFKIPAEPVVVAETPEIVVEEEPVIEPTIQVTEDAIVEESEESEEMSFDLFEEADAESFDLFSTDVVEEPKAEAVIEVEAEKEEIVEDKVGETAEVVIEEALEEMISEVDETETAVVIETEVVIEASVSVEIETAISDEVFIEETTTVTTIIAGDIHPLYKRLVADDNSLAARLMAVRLETLKGAFGFNERLQIIQELFNGSGEDFTKAIETLDTLGSKNEARSIVSNYAHQFEWDKDSNLALEFVQKVERRYA